MSYSYAILVQSRVNAYGPLAVDMQDWKQRAWVLCLLDPQRRTRILWDLASS